MQAAPAPAAQTSDNSFNQIATATASSSPSAKQGEQPWHNSHDHFHGSSHKPQGSAREAVGVDRASVARAHIQEPSNELSPIQIGHRASRVSVGSVALEEVTKGTTSASAQDPLTSIVQAAASAAAPATSHSASLADHADRSEKRPRQACGESAHAEVPAGPGAEEQNVAAPAEAAASTAQPAPEVPWNAEETQQPAVYKQAVASLAPSNRRIPPRGQRSPSDRPGTLSASLRVGRRLPVTTISQTYDKP